MDLPTIRLVLSVFIFFTAIGVAEARCVSWSNVSGTTSRTLGKSSLLLLPQATIFSSMYVIIVALREELSE
jgi:hypothetical protein